MTFFQDFPIPAPPPRGRTVRYVPPPWAGAPRYELPAVEHVGQFLHSSPTLVMAIRSANVFSTGCTFDVSWIFRRSDEDDERWAALNAVFFRGGPRLQDGVISLDSMLLFGVQLNDGTKASTGSSAMQEIPSDPTRRPEAPVLDFRGSGGNGGDEEMAGSGSLWLWPLPPAGDLRLLAQWKDFGMEESSIVLDGAHLREAAARMQPFWPGAAQP
ncbi:hypothetical protein [Pseudarthrobacter sp. NS4]|uniref:hypothetical protein n=1 Tax=Pseudarthrobacter sp. NS4 TaxID=2973976 RepID=UPI002163ABC3|nr:hypothetical protein [Pseudarthrobacter sp. NS4]